MGHLGDLHILNIKLDECTRYRCIQDILVGICNSKHSIVLRTFQFNIFHFICNSSLKLTFSNLTSFKMDL